MSALVVHTRAEQRRSKLLAGFPTPEHPTLNGIDYVEVYAGAKARALASPALASDSLRALRVHFLQAVWLDRLRPEQVVIRGGQRIPEVRALRLLHGVLDGEGDAHDLWVLVGEAGDWSNYTLALLVEPDSSLPPPGFDPVLSRVQLSFKIDCPSALDCADAPVLRREDASGPVIDYLGRDYQSFRTLMLDRMSTLAPSWGERNVADLGVALVEAIAHVADGLSYYEDAVATEAYLATARRRVSVRRHARLLDYRMHEGSSARCFVALQVEAGSAIDHTVLEVGTPLVTRLDRAPPGLATGAALPGDSLVFETLHEQRLHAAANLLFVYTWDEEDVVLPAGATSAVFVHPGQGVLIRGDVLIFVEQYGADPGDPTTGARRFADPKRRHAVRLIADPVLLPPHADPLFPDVRLVQVEWHARDALPFDLCLKVFDLPAGDEPQPGALDPQKVVACVALGNVVLADHGRRFGADEATAESLPVPVAGQHYRPLLERKDVAHTVRYDAVAGAAAPAVDAFAIDPKDAEPAVNVAGDGRRWAARYDLLASDGYAEDFVVEMREDRRAGLRFGDGVHGRAPDGGRPLTVSYRVGGGSAGNIAAGAVCHVLCDADRAAGVLGVTNPLPARGGADPEAIDRVKLLAPEYFKRQERAVRPEDYVALAKRHPEVQQAVARFRWTGSWRTVQVTVDRLGARPVDAAFQEELLAYLEPFRMAGHDLQVLPPSFVALQLALVIHVEPTRLASEVEVAVRAVLGTGWLANGTRGFFHPDELSFGQSIYFSRIVALVMGVSGVERVDVTGERIRFERFEDPASSGLSEGRLRFGPLEIPRLDADPNAPENGRLDLYMEGGL
jgi:hypothetical protein